MITIAFHSVLNATSFPAFKNAIILFKIQTECKDPMTSSWIPPPSTFHSPPSPLLPNTTGYKPPQPLLFHGNLFTTFLTALPTIAWLAPMAYLYSIMNFWSVESIFIFLVSQWREHGGPLSHLGGSHWIDLVGTDSHLWNHLLLFTLTSLSFGDLLEMHGQFSFFRCAIKKNKTQNTELSSMGLP